MSPIGLLSRSALKPQPTKLGAAAGSDEQETNGGGLVLVTKGSGGSLTLGWTQELLAGSMERRKKLWEFVHINTLKGILCSPFKNSKHRGVLRNFFR